MDKTNNSAFVNWFRAASPYIHAFRDSTFVTTFTGESVEDPLFNHLIHDIALLHSLGVRMVIVHGARPQIEKSLKRHKLHSQYAQGIRITDNKALPCVKEAMGTVRLEIEARLSMGLANSPMGGAKIRVASGNFITAKPLGIHEGIDYQHTGEIRRIDSEAIRQRLDDGNLVVLSPIGFSPTGEVFNLTALDVATTVACELNADKLICLTESKVLKNNRKGYVKQLSVNETEQLLSSRRRISEDDRKLLHAAIRACRNTVRRTHFLDQHCDGALLLELFSRDGIGMMIAADIYESIRPATIEDVGGILELIEPLEKKGVLVRRSREQLELAIDRFQVIDRDGGIIGCAALIPFHAESTAELACLVVHPEYHQSGYGNALLSWAEQHATLLKLNLLFVLTTHATHWFRERDFVSSTLSALPIKKKALYNFQRNSKVLIKAIS